MYFVLHRLYIVIMSYATTIKKEKEKGRKLTTVKYRLNLYAWLVTFTFSKIKLTTKNCFSLNFLLYVSVKRHQLLIFLLFICGLISFLISLFKSHPVLLFKIGLFLIIERKFLWCLFCTLLFNGYFRVA